MLDVYLVPVGRTRYEPYCEIPDAPDDAVSESSASPGFVQRLRQRFREMVAEAERDRRHPHAAPQPKGWLGRVKGRLMRWVAESIAEQRLLWHLRSVIEARLFYPDDMDEAEAQSILRAQLKSDFEKHRLWLIVDTLGFIASGAVMVVPGPNLIAYYFAFRLVGHYFSMRGARQGLDGIRWDPVPSAPLTELRRAIELEPDVRVRRVHDVAERLRLEHLASFFERSAA